MSARQVRRVYVVRKERISPSLLRIVFSGDDLRSFPEGYESGYIKLRFLTNENRVYPVDGLDQKPRVRSYTIRHFNLAAQELTIDFAYHNDGGPASLWATNCVVGDEITIDGPGPAKLMTHDADWFFLVGDLAALPALSVNVEKLPASAKGYIVVMVASEEDKVLPMVPKNMEVVWVVNAHSSASQSLLVDAVTSLPWKSGLPAVWSATEFGVMKLLRQYFRDERQVDKQAMYISSYWKLGGSDEEHKKAKKVDADKM